MKKNITTTVGLSAEGTLEIQTNTEASFPRILKALRKGETLALKPTNDKTLFIVNVGEETWKNKDGKTRGILFKPDPREEIVFALNGKTLTRNFWGGNQKQEVKKVVVTSKQSKLIYFSDGMAVRV